MELLIQFPDFSNTSAIDRTIEKRLRTLERRLSKRYENPTITLRGMVLSRRANGAAQMFEAELLVKVPRSKKPFVVRKKNVDFRKALASAADAMEKILRRDSEKLERGRKTVGRSLRSVRELRRQDPSEDRA